MKEKLLTWIKMPVVWIGTAITVLLMVVKYLLSKNRELGVKVENAESDKKDAVLNQQQEDLRKQKEADLAAIEAEKGRKLTDKELEDFLNKL